MSIIGLGGWHVGSIPQPEAIALMHEAIDAGVNFFDNAWDYHMGGSEEVMGRDSPESVEFLGGCPPIRLPSVGRRFRLTVAPGP